MSRRENSCHRSEVAFDTGIEVVRWATEYLQIMSIDRKRIDGEARGIPEAMSTEYAQSHEDPRNLILIRSGVRKLEVRYCEYSLSILNFLAGGSWICGHAVVRLSAEPGAEYRMCGLLRKDEDYAEFWVEDAISVEKVTDPVRVAGLD